MSKRIYWSSVEYIFNEDSPKFGKLKGGAVYAFVKAKDARDSLEKIIKALTDEFLIPVDVEYISIYDTDIEWENDEETSQFMQLYQEAENSNEVIFDVFYEYEKE